MFCGIDNCNNDAKLKQLILCAIPHFQNKRENCNKKSPCRKADYVPEFIIVSDPSAITFLSDTIHGLTAFQHAQNYVYGRDVESCNILIKSLDSYPLINLYVMLMFASILTSPMDLCDYAVCKVGKTWN